jgi:hypothetical protein
MKNNAGAAASSPFSFMDAPAPKKDDKKFDFVKDAMKDECTKNEGKCDGTSWRSGQQDKPSQ